jgi:hypothetical protein
MHAGIGALQRPAIFSEETRQVKTSFKDCTKGLAFVKVFEDRFLSVKLVKETTALKKKDKNRINLLKLPEFKTYFQNWKILVKILTKKVQSCFKA